MSASVKAQRVENRDRQGKDDRGLLKTIPPLRF